MNPNDAFAFDTLAEALIGLRRFYEAVGAAQQAIRLSDGKYGSMHFRLGFAYFDLENWDLASQSYQKAAELDPADPSAAYNVALCMQRLHYFVDAAKWYEEYLRRKPDAQDRTEILERIRALRYR
jgi:tetratricopeptide (TPR) repeat protein